MCLLKNEDMLLQRDDAITEFIFGCGIPYRCLESDGFKKFLNFYAAEEISVHYVKSRMQTIYECYRDVLIDYMRNYGVVSIIMDEWRNVHDKSIVMFTLMPPSHKPIYWKQFNTAFTSLTSERYAELVFNIVQELHNSGIRVSAIMTDNCNTMQSMRKQPSYRACEQAFGRIIKVGCGCHVLNLIAKKWTGRFCPLVKQVICLFVYFTQLREIITTLGNNKVVHNDYEILCRNAKRPYLLFVLFSSSAKVIPRMCETRWCYLHNVLEFVTDIWDILVSLQKCHKETGLDAFTLDYTEGRELWVRTHQLLELFTIIKSATMQIECDIAGYNEIISIKQSLLNGIDKSHFASEMKLQLKNDINEYYNYIDTDLATFLYYINYNVEKNGPLIIGPSCSISIRNIIKRKVGDDATKVLKLTEDFVSIISDQEQVLYGKLSPRKFWRLYSYNQELYKLVMDLMCIPASSASVERAFSIEGNLHSKLRNRLGDDTVDMQMMFLINKGLYEEKKMNRSMLHYLCFFYQIALK